MVGFKVMKPRDVAQASLRSVRQAAEYLNVSTATVTALLRSGKLRGIKVGKLWRIRERDLAEFVEQGGAL